MHDCQGVCFPCRIDKLFTSVSILCILSVYCNIVRGHPILHCCLELHSALLFKSELYSTLIPKLSSALKSELCTTLDSELIRGHPISHLCCLPFHSIFKPKLCSTLPGKSVLHSTLIPKLCSTLKLDLHSTFTSGATTDMKQLTYKHPGCK